MRDVAVRRRPRPACASSSLCRRAPGNPRARARRGSPGGWRPSSIVTSAWPSRLSSSSVSIRSVFQTSERSETRTSANDCEHLRPSSRTPSASDVAGAEHRRVGSACALHVEADLRGAARAVGIAQPVEARQREVAGVRRQRPCALAPGLTTSRAAPRDRAAEHDEVEQRIRAEPVRAVHRYAGRFADGHQARHDRVGIAVASASPLRRGSWTGCRPCCSARSAAPESAPW